jgi:ribosome maturation factor RimP
MLRDTLTGLIRPLVEGMGYELWELEYSPRRGHALVRLYIDSEEGISLEDCERVSRAVSDLLDATDPVPGQYTLEVSSPGIERPLSRPEHFAAFLGERAFVELRDPLDGRRRFTGPLLAADERSVEIEVDGRRCSLPIAGIRKAHLAPEN